MYNQATQTALTTSIPKLEKVTERYSFVSTAELIKDIESQGFTLSKVAGPKRGAGYGKHCLQFTSNSLPAMPGRTMNLLAYNSHDGSSAFQLRLGFLELVCSNGLVVGDALYSQRIIHTGYTAEKVARALEAVLTSAPSLVETVKSLQHTTPNPEQIYQFLVKARELRPNARPFTLSDLARVEHAEQEENTAWNVFNRVQASLVRGGYYTLESTETGTVPGRRAKALTGIKVLQHTNERLWNAASDIFLTR